MIYSHAGIFLAMAQASPTKHSLSRCNYNLYGYYWKQADHHLKPVWTCCLKKKLPKIAASSFYQQSDLFKVDQKDT